MQALQSQALLSSDTHAMDQLQDFLCQRGDARTPVADFDAFAQALQWLFVAAEREALGQALSRFALDVPEREVEGERCHRVLRCTTTYTSAAGPVRVTRSLYRHPHRSHAVCPLELRAGMIEGAWTPLAAKPATWMVAHLTPQEGEAPFTLLGNMTPSQRTLDRLPKQLRTHWEPQRRQFATTLRAQEEIPAAAVTMAVSLDGVLVPMQDGQRQGSAPKLSRRERHLVAQWAIKRSAVPPSPMMTGTVSGCAPVAWPGCRRPIKPPARDN